MSEAAAHFVRYDPGDINSVKICCRQKVSLCSTEGQGEGEGEGGVAFGVSPKIAFLPGSHVFLCTLCD